MARKGLPKAYIKKWGVTKLAWKKFRAKALSKSKPRKAKTTRKKSSPKRRRRNLARKKRGRKGGNLQATLFKYVRYGALLAPGAKRAYDARGAGPGTMALAGIGCYGGINTDGAFDWGLLTTTWSPFIGATLATHFIPKISALIRRL